jgi:hypothetical protein
MVETEPDLVQRESNDSQPKDCVAIILNRAATAVWVLDDVDDETVQGLANIQQEQHQPNDCVGVIEVPHSGLLHYIDGECESRNDKGASEPGLNDPMRLEPLWPPNSQKSCLEYTDRKEEAEAESAEDAVSD